MVYSDCGNTVVLNELESLIKSQIQKAESRKWANFVYPKEAVRLTPGSCLVDPHFNSFVCKAVGELCIKLDEIIGEALHPEYGSVRISAIVRDLERKVGNIYSQFTEKGSKITNQPPVSIKLGSVYAWAREQSGVDFNGLQMCSDLRRNRLRLCRKLCRLVRLSKSSKQRSKSHPLLSSLKHDLMKIRSRAAGKVFSEKPVTLTSHTLVSAKPIRFTEDPFVSFEKPIIQSKLAIIFDKLADQITDLLLPISHLIPGISIVKSADDIGKRRENLRTQIVLAIQGFYCHFNETTTDGDNDDNDPSMDDPMNGSSTMPDPSESSSDDEDITGAKLAVQMNPAIVQASLDRYDHFNWNKQKKFSSIRAKEQAIDQFSSGYTSRQQGSLFKSRCKIELSEPIIHNTEEVSAVPAAAVAVATTATTTMTTTTTSQVNQCIDDGNLNRTTDIEGESNDVPMDAVHHEGTEEKDESKIERSEGAKGEGEEEEKEEGQQHQQQDEQLSEEQEHQQQQELEEENAESHTSPKHSNDNKLTEISRKTLNRSLRSRHSHTPTDTSCSEGEVLSDTEEDQELSDQHHHRHRHHDDHVNDPDQQNKDNDVVVVGVHEKVKAIDSENQNEDLIRFTTCHQHDPLESSSRAETGTTTTTTETAPSTTTTIIAPMNDVNLTELEIMNEWAQPTTISTANPSDISLSEINLPSDESTDANTSNSTTNIDDGDDENDEIRNIFNESLEFCAINLQELISQAEANSNRFISKVNRNASDHRMNSTNQWPIVSISPELEASIERTASAFKEHVTSVLANLLHAVPGQFSSSKSEAADTKLRNPRVSRRQPIIARRGSRLRGMLLAYQKDTVMKRQNLNSSE
uniref:Uncharacterized protein n=1 Tax=Trichobilharzia regenti TaxID=157069 RepID=A0AA85K952_TRIRE|nr:unnamed protein product [Trichobilharzia regenti]